MGDLTQEALEGFLRERFGAGTQLTFAGRMSGDAGQGLKEFGYGKPLLLRWETPEGKTGEGVLSVMKGDAFGHRFWWERASTVLFQYDASRRMDRHVRPLGLGYVGQGGGLRAMDDPAEFVLLTEKAPGHDYYLDLERIRSGNFRPSDVATARRLASWLAQLHARRPEQAPALQGRLDSAELYRRRIRQTIGDHECCLGLIDEAFPHPWPEFPDFGPERFAALEKKLIDWRWRMKARFGDGRRTREVHGDFHPWNILVEDSPLESSEAGAPSAFRVLDRSRGEWGEPADDVTCLAINYLLFGLEDSPRLEGPFWELWSAFWKEYLRLTGDDEILEACGGFFAFRGLVISSPLWYPRHPERVRRGLLRFLERVVEMERFEWADVNGVMG